MFALKNIFKSNNYSPLSSSLLKEYNKNRPLGPQKLACYAPFKSIYFGHHGRAVACCYNRNYVLGRYPLQSIKEIWNGKEADKLRDYIKHNDFSLGCMNCKENLQAGNFDAVKSIQYDHVQKNANGFPSVMEFELSNVCNLECEMCSGDFSSLIRAKREKLPPLENPYNTEFVKQLEEFIPHLEEVKFFGGEPFLVDIYYEIWEKIMEIKPSIKIIVQTNGTVLNNKVKRILENTNFHIGISFDSLQKETYESIRKNAEFERTFENVHWFREYTLKKNTFFGISVCPMRQNWSELPDFITFCNDLNAPVYFHTVFFPTHSNIKDMSAEELKQVSDHLEKFSFPEDTPIRKKNKVHYDGIKGQIKAWHDKSLLQRKGTQIQTLTDLEEILVDHINNETGQKEFNKKNRIEKIREKIELLDEMIAPADFKMIVSGFNWKDQSTLDSLAFYLEKLPVQELVLMAKAKLSAKEG